MKLPNAEQAVIDSNKLAHYCLSMEHPRGRHKARVIAATLGLTAGHAEELRLALLVAVRTHDAVPPERDGYGQRYVVDFRMSAHAGRR